MIATKKTFQGTYTAVVTPFDENNQIDWEAFGRIVDDQISEGINGLVFVGTTGESPTLTHDEHIEILNWSVKYVAGRTQVIHGTGSNNTVEAIEYSQAAVRAGADGILVVNPYYNKPTQEGLYLHFKAIAEAVGDMPVILYNIQGRTGVNLETPTLLRLAKIKNIVAVKEASGNINQMMEVIRQVPDDFSVLVGDDAFVLPFLSLGGDGVISVVSNYIPGQMTRMVEKGLDGDYNALRTRFYKYLDLMHASFVEANPIPAKEIMSRLGYCRADVRLPLCRISEKYNGLMNEMVELVRECRKLD